MDKDTRAVFHKIMSGHKIGNVDRDDLEGLMSDNDKFWSAVKLAATSPCGDSGFVLRGVVEDIVEAEVLIAIATQSKIDSEQPDDEGSDAWNY